MIKYQYYIGLLLFFTSILSLNAQDFESDMKRMYDSFDGVKTFSTMMKIQVFDEQGGMVTEQEAKIIKEGMRFHYTMDQVEMYYDPQVSVWAHGANQQLLLSKRSKKDQNAMKELFTQQIDLDSLSLKSDTIWYEGQVDGAKLYHMEFKEQLFDRVDYHLDSKTGFPKRLVYHYNEYSGMAAQRVEIRFEQTYVGDQLPAHLVMPVLEDYLTIENNTLLPAARFAQYDIEIVE